MECPYCGSEIRIVPEQVDKDESGLPVYHRMAYCDACGYQADLDKRSINKPEESLQDGKKETRAKYQYHKTDNTTNEQNQTPVNDKEIHSSEKTSNNRPKTVKAVYQFHTSDKKPTSQNQSTKAPRKKISIRSIIALILSFFVLFSVFGIALAIYDLIKGKNDGKQHVLSYAAIVIGILTLFIAFSPDNTSGSSYNETETTEAQTAITAENNNEEQIKEETEIAGESSSQSVESSNDIEDYSEQSPESSIIDALGEEYYNHIKSVLTDEIGFENVEFVARQGENNNFEFNCDGITIMVTAYSDEGDEYLRIFQPNSGNVFYEDGQLLMTKEDMDSGSDSDESEDNTIYAEDVAVYQIIAEEIVQSCMKNPSKAKFPSTLSDDWAYGKKGNLIVVKSYVDGINSFGATVRNDYLVEFYLINKDTFSYEVQYIRIGNDEHGEYIDVSE